MRYRLEIGDEGWLSLVEVPDGPLPVRAEGFLVMDRKKSPQHEMFLEIKDQRVVVWAKKGRIRPPEA